MINYIMWGLFAVIAFLGFLYIIPTVRHRARMMRSKDGMIPLPRKRSRPVLNKYGNMFEVVASQKIDATTATVKLKAIGTDEIPHAQRVQANQIEPMDNLAMFCGEGRPRWNFYDVPDESTKTAKLASQLRTMTAERDKWRNEYNSLNEDIEKKVRKTVDMATDLEKARHSGDRDKYTKR